MSSVENIENQQHLLNIRSSTVLTKSVYKIGCKDGVKCKGLSRKCESKVGKGQNGNIRPLLFAFLPFPHPCSLKSYLPPGFFAFSHHRPFKLPFSFVSTSSECCRQVPCKRAVMCTGQSGSFLLPVLKQLPPSPPRIAGANYPHQLVLAFLSSPSGDSLYSAIPLFLLST